MAGVTKFSTAGESLKHALLYGAGGLQNGSLTRSITLRTVLKSLDAEMYIDGNVNDWLAFPANTQYLVKGVVCAVVSVNGQQVVQSQVAFDYTFTTNSLNSTSITSNTAPVGFGVSVVTVNGASTVRVIVSVPDADTRYQADLTIVNQPVLVYSHGNVETDSLTPPTPPPPLLEPEVALWSAAVAAAGGSTSLTQSAVDTYVKACKTDGTWAILSQGIILPFASDTWAGALVPLVAPSGSTFTTTTFTASDYNVNVGIDPGAANVVDKGIVTNVGLGDIAFNTSLAIVAYRLIRSSADSLVNTSSGLRCGLFAPWSDGNVYFEFEVGLNSPHPTYTAPLMTARRRGNEQVLRFNGTTVSTRNVAAQVYASTDKLNLLGLDSFNVTASRHVTKFLYVGQSFTDADDVLHNAAVTAMQVALSRA